MTAYHDPRNLDEAMREIRYLRDASRKHNLVVKERNELRAKIAALEKQEPVAWRYRLKPDCGKTWSAWLRCTREEYQHYVATPRAHDVNYEAQALYAAAGAAPVPEGWKLVPVEALTRWRAAFAEELAAWDIDPPLHHIQTSHDEISAILAAAPKEPT